MIEVIGDVTIYVANNNMEKYTRPQSGSVNFHLSSILMAVQFQFTQRQRQHWKIKTIRSLLPAWHPLWFLNVLLDCINEWNIKWTIRRGIYRTIDESMPDRTIPTNLNLWCHKMEKSFSFRVKPNMEHFLYDTLNSCTWIQAERQRNRKKEEIWNNKIIPWRSKQKQIKVYQSYLSEIFFRQVSISSSWSCMYFDLIPS